METEARPGALRCVVVTPERAVLDEAVDSVVLPMYDGEVGILPGRLPLIGRLGFGELRYRKGGAIHRYYIDGGFAQVVNNVVTVLTPHAIKAEAISVPAAEEALRGAQKMTTTPEAQEAQQRTQDRARAQIRVAQHAGAAGSMAHH